MTSNLIKPDLSKDTTGPFVLDGEAVTYVAMLPRPDGTSQRHIFQRANGRVAWSGDDGWTSDAGQIFLAPKEPKTVFVPWWDSGPGDVCPTAEEAYSLAPSFRATIQLQVDDQGVPVHNSVVRRVEP